MTFDSMDAAMEYVKSVINDVLNNEIAQKGKEIMTQKIQELVYDAYSPVMYSRRGALANGVSVKSGDMQVSIVSNAVSSPSVVDGGTSDMLPVWVNNGNVKDIFHDPPRSYPWTSARDYRQATIDELTPIVKNMLASALKARGIG